MLLAAEKFLMFHMASNFNAHISQVNCTSCKESVLGKE